MESEHGSQSNKQLSKDTDDSRNKDDAPAPLISIRNFDHDSKSEAYMEINNNGKISGSAKNSESPHSTFSSSSNSSTEDYFQIELQMLQKPNTVPVVSPNAREETQSPQKEEKDDAPSDISKSEDLNQKSRFLPTVTHAASDFTTQTMSLVQSAGYDPDRIPASIFASTSSSAMNWSTASNESLFSLQLGNNSFSREQFLMMNGEVFSEDLYNSGELNHSGELKKPVEQVKPRLPPLLPVGKLRKVKITDSNKKTKETEAADETKKYTSKQYVSDQVEEKEPELEDNGNSSFINRPSDGSGASCQSFAFHILVDTTKGSSSKGPSPRQQDTKLVQYTDTPKRSSMNKKNSSYWCCCCCLYSCCSLPRWSCPC